MAETGRSLRADARRNRARVIEAAEELLAAGGLAVPVEDIARRAGVGIGTVYRHFPTKEALFEGIVVSRIERLVEEAKAVAAGEDGRDAFFDFLSTWAAAGAQSKAFMDAMVGAGFDVRDATAAVKREFYDAVAVLLKEAQATGQVRDDIGIDELRVLMTGACLSINSPAVEAGVRDRSLRVLFDGLRT